MTGTVVAAVTALVKVAAGKATWAGADLARVRVGVADPVTVTLALFDAALEALTVAVLGIEIAVVPATGVSTVTLNFSSMAAPAAKVPSGNCMALLTVSN